MSGHGIVIYLLTSAYNRSPICFQKVEDLFPLPINFAVASFDSGANLNWKCITPLHAFPDIIC